jgi:hypothetical protein
MDKVIRDLLADRAKRHRRSRIWGAVGISRCAGCRQHWPCRAYLNARRALRIAIMLPRRSL